MHTYLVEPNGLRHGVAKKQGPVCTFESQIDFDPAATALWESAVLSTVELSVRHSTNRLNPLPITAM